MSDCSVQLRSWGQLTVDELYALLKLRTDVFYLEQKVGDEELDNRDQEPASEHRWIADDLGVVAYIRTVIDAEPTHLDARLVIGRVVVRGDRRGEGLARLLLGEVFSGNRGMPMVLHAQTYISGLYAKFGFESFGEPYLEAGLEHVSMYRAAAVPGA